jgi:hypothetical protein
MPKYKIYWEVEIDGEPATLELKGLWESTETDPSEVSIEVDADPDLIGDDFIGYPDNYDEEHEVVWNSFPIAIRVDED